MDFTTDFISYRQTGYFPKIVTDYLSRSLSLQPFYRHPASLQGVRDAISVRKNYKTNRVLLAEQLQLQYHAVTISEKVKDNITALQNENTFTICTAHQPNIFTGHLYFIYKIIHAIKLADTLNEQIPGNKFVPIFYVGSEDADIEELGQLFINGEKYNWKPKQNGAVGRMKVDDDLLKILKKIKGQLSVEPYGEHIVKLVEECYTIGTTIQQACFTLINKLFGELGLIVLLPDNAALKKQMLPVFEDDIFRNIPLKIVEDTCNNLQKNYKVQAHPREINLFYLKDDIRNRIIWQNGMYTVYDTGIQFTKDELQHELENYPERFSPNVILRALYQETILPNIVFIGGGGELAYWFQLKEMFKHYSVPYPVLVLRNSFLLIEEKINSLILKLQLTSSDIFKPEDEIINNMVRKNSDKTVSLENEKNKMVSVYKEILLLAKEVDATLVKHTEALKAKTIKKLEALETKLLKAEKVKFTVQQNQLKKIRSNLFPHNSLQERVDNFMPFYAKWGDDFIKAVYKSSLPLDQQFCLIKEEK